MASFDQTIPPGGVGKITLSVSTEGYQGNIRKRARVYNNDPENKQTYLTMMAFVKEKEGEEASPSRKPLSPEPFSLVPSLPGPTSQISGLGAGGYDIPPGAEQPGADESVIPPPLEDPSVSSAPGKESLSPVVDPHQPPPLGEESLLPVVDPNQPQPPGEESLSPVVDPNQPPPPGEEPIEPEPSLEQDAESASPSDTED